MTPLCPLDLLKENHEMVDPDVEGKHTDHGDALPPLPLENRRTMKLRKRATKDFVLKDDYCFESCIEVDVDDDHDNDGDDDEVGKYKSIHTVTDTDTNTDTVTRQYPMKRHLMLTLAVAFMSLLPTCSSFCTSRDNSRRILPMNTLSRCDVCCLGIRTDHGKRIRKRIRNTTATGSKDRFARLFMLEDVRDSNYPMDPNHESDQTNQQQPQQRQQQQIEEKALTAPEVNQWTAIMTDPDPFGHNYSSLSNGHFSSREAKTSVTYCTNGSSSTSSDTTYPPPPPILKALESLTPHDLTQIDSYWDELLPRISYLGTEKVSKIQKALRIAYTAHRNQKRKSGEPFIIHPVQVAILLAGLNMDAETVMAGLLHDTVEDTELSFDEIEQLFGTIVKSIVEGETKVSKLPKLVLDDNADEQAENLRQMFVAMTDDYRIIVVKLADRLHNMRTLRYMKPEKQLKISRETLDIFAPLAHRMGIWQFKSELEDTSFMYLYPAEYKRLHRRLRRHQAKFRETLEKSQQILQQTLENNLTLREQAVQVKVSGRTKELYSLWHKMQTKGENNLDHITDVVALRVIIEPKQPSSSLSSTQSSQSPATLSSPQMQYTGGDSNVGVWLCYHVLGLVQHLPGFQPVPTKVKDYISFPKPNGYQSLHTALMLNGQTIEVQIRTSAMHRIAEYGMASHWAYKDEQKRDASNQPNRELYNTPWLSSIKEWQNEALCSRDFVDCVRRELLGKRVFVFLRNGKILNLAKGATVIDAAFQIHTEVGLNMHGVEINGKPVPFSYELRNGDVVSVLTGKGKPETDWMRFAKIRSTRSKLRSYFRKKQRESLRDAGAILFMDFLGMYGELIQNSSFLEGPFQVPSTPDGIAHFLPGKTQYNDVDELLTDIGNSHDRDFLRTAIAKIFLVPKKVLVHAEDDRRDNLSNQILSAVNKKRQNALDVGAALATEGDIDYTSSIVDRKDKMGLDGEELIQAPSIAAPLSKLLPDVVYNGNQNVISDMKLSSDKVEIADPDHLCEICLPIFGDEIIGTRPVGKENECITTVHRCGCPMAQKAINQATSTPNTQHVNSSGRPYTLGGLVSKISKSSSLKPSIKTRLKARLNKNQKNGMRKTAEQEVLEVVKLKWDKSYMEGEEILYLTELSIIAQDRKFLLADCSEIVSDMSEIVRTGSLSTKEHAIFQFLTKVQSVEHLQKLMDSLMEVRSVMS
eukprot:CAMPEP_0176500764 /NCGR_PEP_ID=MMETSP0200_2-20121128/13769_1 /TAXON_ID=947934 /ORGANISM="Chaetoceros sp., Strain GSL56" /LENGTH=1203 /DNA_ID=CAMNT_0017899541 /DNA_START=518 /DNA_END=4125 /DNA_ORIENTATION=+